MASWNCGFTAPYAIIGLLVALLSVCSHWQCVGSVLRIGHWTHVRMGHVAHDGHVEAMVAAVHPPRRHHATSSKCGCWLLSVACPCQVNAMSMTKLAAQAPGRLWELFHRSDLWYTWTDSNGITSEWLLVSSDRESVPQSFQSISVISHMSHFSQVTEDRDPRMRQTCQP